MNTEIKGSTKVYKGYLSVTSFELRDTERGTKFFREVVCPADAVAAVVYNTAKEVFIFVKQFRIGPQKDIIEIVAGTYNPAKEKPEEAMMREVEEEIGYKVDDITHLRSFYSSPGYSSEKMELFLVTVSEQISEGGGLAEENENIEIIEMNALELSTAHLNGEFIDAKTLIALMDCEIIS